MTAPANAGKTSSRQVSMLTNTRWSGRCRAYARPATSSSSSACQWTVGVTRTITGTVAPTGADCRPDRSNGPPIYPPLAIKESRPVVGIANELVETGRTPTPKGQSSTWPPHIPGRARRDEPRPPRRRERLRRRHGLHDSQNPLPPEPLAGHRPAGRHPHQADEGRG